MIAPTAGRVAVLFLIAQGLGASLWWGLLLSVPGSRQAFVPPGWPTATLFPFLLPDFAVFIASAWVSAYGFARGRWWGWPALCVHCGAALYAGLFSVSLPLLFGSPWLAAVLMAPSVLVPPYLVWRLRPTERARNGQC